MSKNDIKNDPIRDFLIQIIAKFKENNFYVLGLVASGVILILVLIRFSNETNNDSIYCLDEIIRNSESFKDFCDNENMTSADINLFIQSVVSILDTDKDLSLDEKILLMKEVNINNQESDILKSLYYRELAEMYIDVNNYETAIDTLLISLTLHDDNKSYSANLYYKLAYCLLEIGNTIESRDYINKAVNCDFENSALNDKINFLVGKISYFEND